MRNRTFSEREVLRPPGSTVTTWRRVMWFGWRFGTRREVGGGARHGLGCHIMALI